MSSPEQALRLAKRYVLAEFLKVNPFGEMTTAEVKAMPAYNFHRIRMSFKEAPDKFNPFVIKLQDRGVTPVDRSKSVLKHEFEPYKRKTTVKQVFPATVEAPPVKAKR